MNNFTERKKTLHAHKVQVNYWYLQLNPEAEIWEKINDRYCISSQGRIRSQFQGKTKFLKIHFGEGYKRFHAKLGGNYYTLKVHRFIAKYFIPNPLEKDCVDHINGNTCDNSIGNLRWAHRNENSRNCKKQKNTSSKYKGVHFHKGKRKWQASICVTGNRKHLGYFDNEQAAGMAYNTAAEKYFGEFAKLNEI